MCTSSAGVRPSGEKPNRGRWAPADPVEPFLVDEEQGAGAEGLGDEIVRLSRADGDHDFARELTKLRRRLDRGVLPREMKNQLAFPMRMKIERATPPSGFSRF
jgi:hypothetical protein